MTRYVRIFLVFCTNFKVLCPLGTQKQPKTSQRTLTLWMPSTVPCYKFSSYQRRMHVSQIILLSFYCVYRHFTILCESSRWANSLVLWASLLPRVNIRLDIFRCFLVANWQSTLKLAKNIKNIQAYRVILVLHNLVMVFKNTHIWT